MDEKFIPRSTEDQHMDFFDALHDNLMSAAVHHRHGRIQATFGRMRQSVLTVWDAMPFSAASKEWSGYDEMIAVQQAPETPTLPPEGHVTLLREVASEKWLHTRPRVKPVEPPPTFPDFGGEL